MAVNLASNYSSKIAEKFKLGSYIAGKTSGEYDFSGVNSIKIYTPTTVALDNYSRTGTARYGTPTEMQDTIQEMAMTQDKSASLVIDKGNNEEQLMIKNAGKMIKLEVDEQVIPMVDKYAFSQIIKQAGTIDTIAAAPTKSTIIAAILDGAQALDDAGVPESGRYLFITGAVYKVLLQAPEFLALDKIGSKAYEKGMVGEVAGIPVVKVPTSYLPTGAYFVIWHKSAIIMPYKIKEAKFHTDPPGISGALLEFRNMYDCFILGARATGVYVCVLAANQQAAVTQAVAANVATLTSASASAIKYTTDGTDPRYSSTAVSTTTGGTITLTEDITIKAVAYSATKFTSDIASLDLEYTAG